MNKFGYESYGLLKRLAYPDRYANTEEWNSGDGPAEKYFQKLSEEAKQLFELLERE